MISIITSLYKSEKYLEKYLENVDKFSKQAQFDFEVIAIVNDPTEFEKAKLTNFKKNHPFLKIMEIPREPLYATWNRGVRAAQGAVVGFWNVDDVRYPKAVADGLSLIEQGNDLVYFPFRYKRYVHILGFDMLAKNKIIQVPEFDRAEFMRSMICGPFFIFKKEFFEKVSPFDEQFKIAGDFDWCVRAAKIGTFARSKEVAGLFTNNGTSLSGSKSNRHEIENNIIYKKNQIFDKIKE